MKTNDPILSVRPYQLLCLICSLDSDDQGVCDPEISQIKKLIQQDPGLPLALRCHSDDSFSYQSPGRDADTPEGKDFNQKRDMEILFRMDLAPGAILPARIALARLHKSISSTDGICGFKSVTAPAWKGCRFAGTDRYKRGHEQGIDVLFPQRDDQEMQREKTQSLETMLTAKAIQTRPHILLCAVAQWGRGIRPPFEEDNLPELLQHILLHPETPITLVPGADWMMCAPCPQRCTKREICLGPGHVHSGGLFNELKDLRVLQVLGLTFGTTLPAKEIFSLIFSRIPTPIDGCVLGSSVPEFSVWQDPCPCTGYEDGRAELIKKMKYHGNAY